MKKMVVLLFIFLKVYLFSQLFKKLRFSQLKGTSSDTKKCCDGSVSMQSGVYAELFITKRSFVTMHFFEN